MDWVFINNRFIESTLTVAGARYCSITDNRFSSAASTGTAITVNDSRFGASAETVIKNNRISGFATAISMGGRSGGHNMSCLDNDCFGQAALGIEVKSASNPPVRNVEVRGNQIAAYGTTAKSTWEGMTINGTAWCVNNCVDASQGPRSASIMVHPGSAGV